MNSLENFSLEGKVALITGAGRGLGAIIAETLVGAGASVMLTDIDGESAAAQAQRLQGQGGGVLSLSLIHISEPTRRRDSSRMPSSA